MTANLPTAFVGSIDVAKPVSTSVLEIAYRLHVIETLERWHDTVAAILVKIDTKFL